MILLRILGFCILVILPGAWVTFGLRLKGLSFPIKLLTGMMAGPIVVAAQFYVLRLLTIPFEWTALALVFLNLPVLYLIYRQRERPVWPNRETLAAGVLVFLFILAAIAPFLLDAQKRLFTWEAWSQSDVVYSFANGELDLQDAELAGVRLSYPWVGQVDQAVTSYLLNTPPASNYIWMNLIWLVCIFAFVAAITAELGGGPLAQVFTAVWLSFGVNFVGSTVQPLIPASFVKAHITLGNIWGDNRYTPWLDKIVFFGQMYFGMGIFIAILYLLIRAWPAGAKRNYIILTGILMAGLGLIYPALLPPACILAGARGLMELFHREDGRPAIDWGEILGLALVSVAALALTLVYTRFLTQYRTGASLINLHPLYFMKWRTIESVVVTSPLLLGLAWVFISQWKAHRKALVILGLGALGSAILYILFDIPWWRNEYKYIFTAAICLAAFPSLALEPVLRRLHRLAVPAMLVVMAVLALPFINHIYNETYQLYTRRGPMTEVDQFSMRLDDREPLAKLVDAIQQNTPKEALLLVENADFYYPALVQRQLYAPPKQANPYPGILVTSDEMITLVKGYPAQVLADRRAVLADLFTAADPNKTAHAFQQILEFKRPLAVALDVEKDAALIQWLKQENFGQSIFQDSRYNLYLIQPDSKILTMK